MHTLLISNIRKSIKIIAEEHPKIPKSLIATLNSEKPKTTSIVLEFAQIAAQPIPSFYWDSAQEIQSPQEPFFGFYALRNAIRGTLLGFRFVQAADLLLKRDFFAASISLFYTASFHLINSFLSLNGRVFIDNVQGLPKAIRDEQDESKISQLLDPPVKVAIGVLMKNNQWKFEPRKRTHTNRLEELRFILLKRGYKVPDFFTIFFKYLLFYENSLPERDLIDGGIHRLVDVRHESLYHGYGYDDIAHDALMNREFVSGQSLKLKAEKYESFTMGLLKYNIKQISALIPKLPGRHIDDVRALLVVSVNTPPFEIGFLPIKSERKLNKEMKQIFEWLWLTVVKNGRGNN